ncbi:M28 family peptidase [Bacillus sp. H-16]|uniref:M28 family peptidase n=1 Tax=Alteribacter salitolerans TaxID=2912333 RepID=UPI00196438BE|nr:M28 family peptidase [Alteribacter salitolerans]MBM7095451.1 M28 family peptidase [Alteribacter salitolerans]
MKKGLVAFLASLMVLTVPMGFSGSSLGSGQTVYAEAPGESGSAFDKRITQRFDTDRVMDHIYYLTEEIGPRVAGTEEEKETAAYIQDQLEEYGYDVSTQEFDIANRLSGTLISGEDEFAIRISPGSASTGEEGVLGEIVYSGLGLEGDFPAEVDGNIALIQRGEIPFWDKVNRAQEAGAAGVIIFDNAEALVPPTPSLGANQADVPVVGITKADGERLLEENMTAVITISEVTDQVSQNVIAVKEPKGKKSNDAEIVYATAHYDSVPYSPGASDNASGTGVVLELARIMAPYPTEKEIRFVFVGAEEIGLVGSRYYVSQLSEGEIARSAANFNLDMVGTNWEPATSLYVNVVDGAPNQVWQSASGAAERLGNDSLILFERGASDHVAFYEAGIDAANFIRREPGTAALEPWYHTPFDTIDKISESRLQEGGQLIGAAIYDFARKEHPGKGKSENRRATVSGAYLLNEDQTAPEAR